MRGLKTCITGFISETLAFIAELGGMPGNQRSGMANANKHAFVWCRATRSKYEIVTKAASSKAL